MNTSTQLATQPKVYGYISGYDGPKLILEQIRTLNGLFPDMKLSEFRPDEYGISIPKGAEGLFAVPRWRKFGNTYWQAVKRVLAKIEETRGLYIYTGGRFPHELEQYGPSDRAWSKIADLQRGQDVYIFPAQFGRLRIGSAIPEIRVKREPREFGLGIFQCAIMLLTHPERLGHFDDLRIVCSGDTFIGKSISRQYAPFMYFNDGIIKVNEYHIKVMHPDTLAHSSVPTGFLPA